MLNNSVLGENTIHNVISDCDLKHISPIGLVLRANLEHKVITTIPEFEAFKNKAEGFEDHLDQVFFELEQKGIIEVIGEEIVLKVNNIWSTTDLASSLKSVPELARIITERGLKTRMSGSFNKYLDFGVVHYFPDDAELLKEASAIMFSCGEQLNKLSKMSSKNKKNRKVRAVSFSAAYLDEGDF